MEAMKTSYLHCILFLLFLSLAYQPSAAFLTKPLDFVDRLQALGLIPGVHLSEYATVTALSGLGDLLAQRQSMNLSKDTSSSLLGRLHSLAISINWPRTRKFMVKGFVEGILWRFWYRWADRMAWKITLLVLGDVNNAAVIAVFRTIVSLAMELGLACPFIYGFWDIPFMALGTMPISQIPKRVRSKLGGMLLASFKVWTPVNIVIYNIPVQFRLVVSCIADIFWQSIVSTIVTTTDDDNKNEEAPGNKMGKALNARAVPATQRS